MLPRKISSARTWWIACRPFSFAASAMPVIFGSVLALSHGGAVFDLGLFVLAVLAMAALHAAANILNDVCDFRRGIDREVFPSSGAVIRGLLPPRTALKGAAVLLTAGCAIGMFLAYRVNWSILFLGLFGVAVGIGYSARPLGLKYRGLGDAAVFLDFGLLGALGGWIVQTGRWAWLPVVWAVPLAMLIVGILHANNWRDMQTDRQRGTFSTVGSFLGDRGSRLYYVFLVGAPFLLVAGFIAVPRLVGAAIPMPYWAMLVFLCWPMARRRIGRAKLGSSAAADRSNLETLDQAVAQLNLAFGSLYTLSLMLGYFFQ